MGWDHREIFIVKGNRTFLVTGAAMFAALVVILALLPPARAQISKYLRTTNFSYFEYYEGTPRTASGARTNRLKSHLTGTEGQYLPGDLVRVTKARLEYYGTDGRSTNLIAHTPQCLLDRHAGVLSSTNALQAVANGGELHLEGWTGFLFEMTNRTFHISNRVRTVIQQGLMVGGTKANQ